MTLFCINKTSPLAARMIENGIFCINTFALARGARGSAFSLA
jgi:flavin reductase